MKEDIFGFSVDDEEAIAMTDAFTGWLDIKKGENLVQLGWFGDAPTDTWIRSQDGMVLMLFYRRNSDDHLVGLTMNNNTPLFIYSPDQRTVLEVKDEVDKLINKMVIR